MAEIPEDLVLVGRFRKPFGLFGEIKVDPETFDFERHSKLKSVFCRLRAKGEIAAMTVRASRADSQFWYLQFENCHTPEAVGHLSGGQLLVAAADRLELPSGMVYFSDMPGLAAVDSQGNPLGTVQEVLENGAQECLILLTPRGEVAVPWNDHFVRRIDLAGKAVELDISALRGILF